LDFAYQVLTGRPGNVFKRRECLQSGAPVLKLTRTGPAWMSIIGIFNGMKKKGARLSASGLSQVMQTWTAYATLPPGTTATAPRRSVLLRITFIACQS
jgi:hypothetical protein